jgi:hypothetical protein
VAYSRYGWGQKATSPAPSVGLVPGIDPEHLNPTDQQYVDMNPLWSGFAQPSMPDDLVGDLGGGPIGGGGPLDYTPDSPDFGVGGGPGLTTEESQQIRGALMSADFGASAARLYQATTDRYDGTGPHVEIIPDENGAAPDSPATLQYQRTGVGQPNDPYARAASRIKRWWDRHIDRHTWDVTMRPSQVVNAYTAQPQPPVPGGTQYDSPYATSATNWMGTPDRFVDAQMRRVPDLDPNYVGDGVNLNPYALSSWGL